MTSTLIQLQQVKDKKDLLEAWEICVEIARRFPNDSHWGEVIEAFRKRGQELETDLRK